MSKQSVISFLPILILKFAIGGIALSLVLIEKYHRVSLSILTGFEWAASLFHLCMLITNFHHSYWKWVSLLLEIPSLGISLWWLDIILLSDSRPMNNSYRCLETSLATLLMISNCFKFIIPNQDDQMEYSDTNSKTLSSSSALNHIVSDIIQVNHKLNPLKGHSNSNSNPNTTDSDDKSNETNNFIDAFPSSQVTSDLSILNNNPQFNNLNPPYQQENIQFLLPSTPTMEYNFETFNLNHERECERNIQSLNIPQISTSPIRTCDDQSLASKETQKIPWNLVTPISNNDPPTPLEDQFIISNNYKNDDMDISNDSGNFYDTLNKEIKDNCSIRHQTSVPNLPSELMNNHKTHIVRHSWSYSHLNSKINPTNSKHSRSSSHSPIKKFSKTFKDSISLLPNNEDIESNDQNTFELNMDLVKSIQRSPKKRNSMRSLNHHKLPSINEPTTTINPMISQNFNEFEEKRVVSSNSIPDGYFSSYDREKWQAIKNIS